MKKLLALFLFLLFARPLLAQYEPKWESLDARPVPEWYKDAKFGIFIHWGVYSVPGYSSKGSYAEWYQNGLMNGDSDRIKFHQKKFGNRTYYDLANDFKAELFKPDEWAKLFEQSGAKYIVLTSKHHDGFCLWPDQTANQSWGFKWNAFDVGPKRDLLGELFTAVRKTSVRAGMYYSLYEWYNPLWLSNRQQYVEKHMLPQMKSLINTYQPDVLWTDGDWDASAETLKSREFLTWLYNESPVKEKIVTYDRWGSGIRFKHGGVYTPEYQPDLDFEDHAWEESRGMGYSYGYNREEDAWDYNSAQSLVLQLIDKVSRGGNFLLDIGPDEHGKIPPIMQERLLQIGEWLKINGEAIYNTVRWKTASQWSEGRKDYSSKSGDMLLKITVDPDPGYAVKELFYTYNAMTNSLYAIFPKYPDSRKLVIKDMDLPEGTSIDFLSTKEKLNWKKVGTNIEILLPEYNPNTIKADQAFVVKISNYGKFASKPEIKVEYHPVGSLNPLVSFTTAKDKIIRYTLDGSEPTLSSNIYIKPFTPEHSATINAKTFQSDALPSVTMQQKVIRYEWMKATNVKTIQPGIVYKYYEPTGKIDLNAINSSNVIKTGTANEISEKVKLRKEKYALSFDGFIKAPKNGFYSFFTVSDDGSKLFIDDAEIVNNDGEHNAAEQFGKTPLMKGYHKIKVVYFDTGGGNELKVYWQPEGQKKTIIPGNILFH